MSDIVETYDIEASKITVAHNGFNTAYKPLTERQVTEARGRFSDNKPYFIFIGNFSYRKNIHGIVKGYDHYRNQGGTSKFVMVGNPLWHYKEMDHALAESNYAEDIIFTGRLEIEDLVMAMGGAQALVFPSFFEGFGIPVVEAFACGTPVICSNNTSLPEIAGDAALFVDAHDTDAIGTKMHMIEKNISNTKTLIDKGFQRKENFSWEHTANKVKTALFQ